MDRLPQIHILLVCLLNFIFIPTLKSQPAVKSYQFENTFTDSWGLKQKLSLKIRRIVNEGRPPIILSHALVLNGRAMEKIGVKLWEQGYDVWLPNVRGHGNGEEKSTISPYLPNDYGFDEMLKEDIPLIFKKVSEITQQKVNLVGFSMGALLWEKYLSGFAKGPSGKLIKSKKVAQERAKFVRSFIALGIPLNFKRVNPQIRLLFYPVQPLVRVAHFFIPLTSDHNPEISFPTTIREWARRSLIKAVKPIFLEVLPLGILSADGIDVKNGEFEELTYDHISQAHTDLTYDFVRWLWHPFGSRDGRVIYSGKRSIKTPTLIILGEKDYLAPFKGSKELIKTVYPKNSVPKVLKFCKKAHVDMILKRALSSLTETMLEFLEHPNDFKKENLNLTQIGECL